MISMWSLSATLALLASTQLEARASSYTCTQVTIPVPVATQSTKLPFANPANNTALTGFVADLITSLASTETPDFGKNNVSETYNIWSELCVPDGFKNGTLEFAVHGIGFDHSYWTFGGKGSKYNFAESALKAGNAIFYYDRLGQGKSSTPDGIQVIQTSTQVAVAASLVNTLRKGYQGYTFSKIVGIGHSFGSIQLKGLITNYGNILDDIVLTGLAALPGSAAVTVAAFGLNIAAVQNPARFGKLDTSYLTTEGIYNDQLIFLHYSNFEFSVLQKASEGKGVLTIGELATLVENLTVPATNYTGGVYIITGQEDFIFCGGNCTQPLGGAPNLLDALQGLFPASSSFQTNIIANTGHGINLHLSAPTVFEQIQSWVAGV